MEQKIIHLYRHRDQVDELIREANVKTEELNLQGYAVRQVSPMSHTINLPTGVWNEVHLFLLADKAE